MKNLFYSDVRINRVSGDVLSIGTMLFSVLHGIFKSNEGKYALALPSIRTGDTVRHPGSIFRVFYENEDEGNRLFLLLTGHKSLGDKIAVSPRPIPVPSDFSGEWAEYRRFRIPSRKSTMLRDSMGNRSGITTSLRIKRMNLAESLPFFRFNSKSTGQAFSLHIEQREGTPGEVFSPDGFGLSSETRSFALPVLG